MKTTRVKSCEQAACLRAFKAQAGRTPVCNSTELKFETPRTKNQP